MTTDLPDPHGCPHCGHAGLAERWGETICGMCHAPRVHAEPGCPVRNVLASAEPTGFDRFVADATRIMRSAEAKALTALGRITAESIAEGEAAVREGRYVTLDSLRKSIERDLAKSDPIVEEVFGPCVTAETARERRVHDGGPRINP